MTHNTILTISLEPSFVRLLAQEATAEALTGQVLLHADEVGGLEARRGARRTQQFAQLGDGERHVQRAAPPEQMHGAQPRMQLLERRERATRHVARLHEKRKAIGTTEITENRKESVIYYLLLYCTLRYMYRNRILNYLIKKEIIRYFAQFWIS